MFAYPMEDIRALDKYNMRSFLEKTLIFIGVRAGRASVMIVRAPIGF